MAGTANIIDHLFRHQHGKLVSILCRVFGLQHLETIEDAVQDTFVKASVAWRSGIPENPEAWLTTAAKNRMIDLFRKIKSEKERAKYFTGSGGAMALDELFLDSEIADSQLRMIFTACHPDLDARDQIAFALKTIAGFSQGEIAVALLLKDETIKKRLSRARAAIKKGGWQFEIPVGSDLVARRLRVLEVLYLIFNEGFHSIKKEMLIRQELCAEAMRLCKILVDHPLVGNPDAEALLALMCFQVARLESKIDSEQGIIDLEHQDRSKWNMNMVIQGNMLMNTACKDGEYGYYHYEAAIAAEHLRAKSFEETDWKQILHWYEQLQEFSPSPFNVLNMAVVNLQSDASEKCKTLLETIDPKVLEKRAYLYHGCWAKYYQHIGRSEKAIEAYDRALALVSNEAERKYMEEKRAALL